MAAARGMIQPAWLPPSRPRRAGSTSRRALEDAERSRRVPGEVVEVRRRRALGVEARRVADAALVVAEDDEAERGVEVDHQVVAVAVAGFGAVDDRERGVAARRGGARHLADDPDPLAPEGHAPARHPHLRAGARPPAGRERQLRAADDDRPLQRPLDEIGGAEAEPAGACRLELAEVAGARVGVEEAVGGDGEADDASVAHPIGPVEREQRTRLVGGGRRGRRGQRDGESRDELHCLFSNSSACSAQRIAAFAFSLPASSVR